MTGRMRYSVLDAKGAEVVAWTGDVARTSEVRAVVGEGHVALVRGDEVLARNDIGARDIRAFSMRRVLLAQ